MLLFCRTPLQGVLNVLEGCVGEIEIKVGITEESLSNPSSLDVKANSTSCNDPVPANFSSHKTMEDLEKCHINECNQGDGDLTCKTNIVNSNHTFLDREQKLFKSSEIYGHNSREEEKMKHIDINTMNNELRSTRLYDQAADRTFVSNKFVSSSLYKKANKGGEKIEDQMEEEFPLEQKLTKSDAPKVHYQAAGKFASQKYITSHKNKLVDRGEQDKVECPVEVQEEPSTDPETPASNENFVPYIDLKGVSDIAKLPSGVDPLNREASLSDKEFFEVFEMDKDSFYKLPSWKRLNKKKAMLLF